MDKPNEVESILTSLRRAGESSSPVRVHGALPSARAWIVARSVASFLDSDPRGALVICADADAAAEFAADLTSLSKILLNRDFATCLIPTWDQSPYWPISPSIRVRSARARALALIGEHSRGVRSGPLILISTLGALSQASLPRDEWKKRSLLVETGQSIESRESLVRRLYEAGYLRTDSVEDPGTVAVRGEIVDVFPPGQNEPIRIELFDDIVERMRPFDPATQRSRATPQDSLESVMITPAREVLIHPQTSSRIRERVKQRADDLAVSRSVRDPILASIGDGIYPDHSDAWAPFAYEKASTLLEHMPADWPIFWNDEQACREVAQEQLEKHKKAAADAPQAGLILPEVSDLFTMDESFDGQINKASRLYMDRLELTRAGGSTDSSFMELRVACTDHSELATQQRHSLTDLEPRLRLWLKQGFQLVMLASTQSQGERIRFLLDEHQVPNQLGAPIQRGLVSIAIGSISSGFVWPAEGLILLSESELLGTKNSKRPRRTSAQSSERSAARDWSGLQALTDLNVEDCIVHVDHGIGRYQGLVRLDLNGAPSDFLLIEYANKDKLYLPVYRLGVIQKYVGSGATVALDKLGGVQFAKAKEKVREAVKRLAIDLVKLYAERKIRPGVAFSPRDSAYREFEALFPFEETPDQLQAIDATLADMESGKSMDRLVCGDVGYGKTEVAIRAAFRAVSDGKQVAVLVPTTVLAHQHEQSFKARLKDYPLLIESVSRFKSAREQKAVLQQAKDGKVDILIGTHRLLSRDVQFKDLGLIIVDEEHRFGVEHKEKLKALKVNTHVLTLTATPIPRTLHMALSGLRDISLINTPPVDRLPIRTYLAKLDDALIQQAIETELARGGQVFFVHNRVQNIFEIASRIRALCPSASIGVGHGQMADGELEDAMMAFYQKKTNVLVCTSIIESGLDVPSANTIIVNRADHFGLAQLYQIRGRVGRGQVRAYAYLLLPETGAVSEDAKKRLEVIQRFVELGSGFSIASHDLEIRGGGDLLGAQQSGHIAAVGFDLYTELLEDAIRELQRTPRASIEESHREPEIKAPFAAYFSEQYIPDVHQRLSLYRRCSSAADDAQVVALEEELQDRFGPLPEEAKNLLWMIRIKIQLKALGIDSLTVGPERISLVPGRASRLDPIRAIALVSAHPGLYQLMPDSKFVAKLKSPTLRDLYFGMEALLKELLPRSA